MEKSKQIFIRYIWQDLISSIIDLIYNICKTELVDIMQIYRTEFHMYIGVNIKTQLKQSR